ncbi:chloride channel protein [Salmonella enterica subsp. enterica serovar Weltevreden]|nr:chloride channel protein [Salmonella enterica subsp. enterica serovar Weltevreden]
MSDTSLPRPRYGGNGYSVVQLFLPSRRYLAGLAEFLCAKSSAVLASSGSGAPGGVFTPNIICRIIHWNVSGSDMGILAAKARNEIAILLGLAGMADATGGAQTHAPIMSTLMICEMTGASISYPSAR